MKSCTKCNQTLSVSEFYRHSKRKDGTYTLRPICKACCLIQNKAYLKANPQIRKKNIQKRIEAKRKIVRALKHNQSCLDCSKSYPFWVMQFDHVRGQKVAKISRIVNSAYTVRNLQDELAKCELVCANCHADRTYQRLNR